MVKKLFCAFVLCSVSGRREEERKEPLEAIRWTSCTAVLGYSLSVKSMNYSVAIKKTNNKSYNKYQYHM
jgi:hypothetical protein